jgi:choline dehydrogenase
VRDLGSYDYVVVGGGSAGCVLAARLSEDEDVSIALIEAGPEDTATEIKIPAAFPSLFKTRWDWDFDSDPEPGLGGRRAYLPRGRMLGGSSSMNAMVYIRGNPADYDAWAGDGAPGWGYDDVLPYFIRSEDNERGADEFHGVGGPLRISDSRAMSRLVDAYLEGAIEAGHHHNPDFNGAEQTGVGRFQLTQRDGVRWSAADAFLRPALERPNLTVITDAHARRVLFEGERATGVEVEVGGDVVAVNAEREVVLSAGAYGSPHLLLLSGVGPADELGPFGITVVADLPVGRGLQDHMICGLNYLTDEESLLTAMTPENVERLQRDGSGPLTCNIDEGGGHIETKPSISGPDVQLHSGPALFVDEGLSAPPQVHGTVLAVTTLSPQSRGTVSLRSADPGAAPRIVHNYLNAEEDRRSMIEGLRAGLDIADQPARRKVITGKFAVPTSDSDDDLLAHARRRAQTQYHPTSTCAIGAVVDTELRVLGLDALRVVDASVMPTIVRGNTNAPTIMIAEKAADLIRLPGLVAAVGVDER